MKERHRAATAPEPPGLGLAASSTPGPCRRSVAERRRSRSGPPQSTAQLAARGLRRLAIVVPVDLLARVEAAAGDERGAMTAAVREALEAWVSRKAR